MYFMARDLLTWEQIEKGVGPQLGWRWLQSLRVAPCLQKDGASDLTILDPARSVAGRGS